MDMDFTDSGFYGFGFYEFGFTDPYGFMGAGERHFSAKENIIKPEWHPSLTSIKIPSNP